MLTVTYADCHILDPYTECSYAECLGASKLRVKKVYEIDTWIEIFHRQSLIP